MSRLESLELDHIAALDLGPIRGVASTLRRFGIDGMRGDFDGAPIASLVDLRVLSLDADDVAAAAAFARIDLTPLTRLEVLHATVSGGRMSIELAAIARMPRLELVKLLDFTVQEHDIAVLCAAPALRALSFTPATPRVSQRLRECLGDKLEQLADFDEISPNPLRRIHERTVAGDRREFSVGIDLAGDWELESNIDAESRLRALLTREAPELARRLSYDTEGSAVWLIAAERALLTAALELIDAETRRSQIH
jgi:hypothetical protein